MFARCDLIALINHVHSWLIKYPQKIREYLATYAPAAPLLVFNSERWIHASEALGSINFMTNKTVKTHSKAEWKLCKTLAVAKYTCNNKCRICRRSRWRDFTQMVGIKMKNSETFIVFYSVLRVP